MNYYAIIVAITRMGFKPCDVRKRRKPKMAIEYLGEQIPEEKWSDWKWQIKNCARNVSQFSNAGIPISTWSYESPLTTPHLALQIKRLFAVDHSEGRKFARTILPSPEEDEVRPARNESNCAFNECTDGTGTGYQRKQYGDPPVTVRRLYSDRAILITSLICPCRCRYCFRWGDLGQNVSMANIGEGINYIRQWNTENPNQQIRDIILSGGDPLMVDNDRLSSILKMLSGVPGVEVIRIDTKCPAALPQRFTPSLIDILEEYVSLLCLHFSHPGEISSETVEACRAMARRGIILRAYIPLLRGVNDSRKTLKELFWRLFSECKVTPYYLVQMIETPGGQHFKVPLEQGIELMDRLQVEISGVALPKYICYLPDGGGKVELGNQTLYGRTEDGYWLRSPITSKPALYPDPIE